MFITLFRKECAQTAKSLIYWLYVACLVLFFNSQLGNMHILTPPQEGQADYLDYGYQTDITEQDIMETGTGSLVWHIITIIIPPIRWGSRRASPWMRRKKKRSETLSMI